jgi:hypothetical protein
MMVFDFMFFWFSVPRAVFSNNWFEMHTSYSNCCADGITKNRNNYVNI